MIRNFDAEKQLKEAWNRHLDNYETLLNMYKEQNYKIKRNDKTGNHIVQKDINTTGSYNNPMDIFGDIFGGIR